MKWRGSDGSDVAAAARGGGAGRMGRADTIVAPEAAERDVRAAQGGGRRAAACDVVVEAEHAGMGAPSRADRIEWREPACLRLRALPGGMRRSAAGPRAGQA